MDQGAKGAGRPRIRIRHRRWALAGATGGFGAIAVLCLVAPGLLAVAPMSKTYHAPYNSAKVFLTDPSSRAGCGGGLQSLPSFFNKTSGLGGFDSNVSTLVCSSHTNNSAKFVGELGEIHGWSPCRPTALFQEAQREQGPGRTEIRAGIGESTTRNPAAPSQ